MTSPRGPELVVLPNGLRRGLRVLVPVLAALVVLALVLVAGQAARGRSASGGPPPAQQPTRALVLSGSSLSYDGATRTAQALGWDATVYSLPGIGYSRSTLDLEQNLVRSIRELLPVQPPDLVVVQGGEADHSTPRDVLTRAVLSVVDEVAGRGSSQLVLIGPIPGAQVPDSLRRVNDTLAAQAGERGVPYVDALRLGWRVGDPAVPDLLAQELARLLD